MRRPRHIHQVYETPAIKSIRILFMRAHILMKERKIGKLFNNLIRTRENTQKCQALVQ